MKMESHCVNVNALMVIINAVMQLHYLSMPLTALAGQMLCALGKHRKTQTVKSVQELYPPPPAMEGYKPLGRKVMEDDRQWFYQELEKYGNFTGMAWILSPEPQRRIFQYPELKR